MRQAIAALVQQTPGMTRKWLAGRLGLSWHGVGHHVRRLVVDGILLEHRSGRSIHVFHAQHGRERRATVLAFTHRHARSVFLALTRPMRAADLARLLGLGRKSVSSALVHLRLHGLVERASDGRYARTLVGEGINAAMMGVES